MVSIYEFVDEGKDREGEREGDQVVRSVFFCVQAADYLWNHAKLGNAWRCVLSVGKIFV